MRSKAAAFAFTLAVALAAAPAHAQLYPWADLHGGASTYGMSDVNTDIGDINDQLAGSGLSMDEIHHGPGFGLAFGLELPEGWSYGFAYDRLFASSDVGDGTTTVTYKLPANAYRLLWQYATHGAGVSGPHLGASVGWVSSAGSVEIEQAQSGTTKADIDGVGALFEGYAGGDYWQSRQFGFTGSLGFRYAKINETKIHDRVVYLSNGKKESIDYSGVFIRVGILYAFVSQ